MKNGRTEARTEEPEASEGTGAREGSKGEKQEGEDGRTEQMKGGRTDGRKEGRV